MKKVIIIDDDKQVRELFEQVLVVKGRYKVVLAHNGETGLKLFHESPADLLITDIFMPKKNGFEVINELKHDFPETKIIAISGGDLIGPEDYTHTARQLGADCTLKKPFKMKEILNSVRDLIGDSEP